MKINTRNIFLFLTVMLSAGTSLHALELTLEEYITLVEKNSKQLMQAAKDVEIAAATEKAAASQAYPMIGAQAGYTRNLTDIKQPYPVAAGPDGTLIYRDVDVNLDNELSFGLSLDQQLFNMKVFNAIKASREYRLMTGYIMDAQKQAILTMAKKVYYQNFLLEKLLEVKISMENNTHENYLNIKNKYESGLISQFDLLRAEVDWKMKIPETTQARKNLDLARINFKNLAGISQEEEIILDCSFGEYPEMPVLISPPDILADRPDYKTLIREISLREINIRAARADHYPTVSGNILYALSAGSDTFSFDDSTRVVQAGIVVSVPIFTGGALAAQDRKARAEYEQAEIRLRQLKEDVSAEISSIYLLLKETSERIDSASATLETAEKAYEIAQASYTSGMATQLDLKDATVSLELARINHLSAVYEYLASYFDWQHAVGKAVAE